MSGSQNTLQLDALRRAAKRLAKDHALGLPAAQARLRTHPPRRSFEALRHADYLHVIAQENNFASWPALKLAAETLGVDRAALQQRLKLAVAHGQNSVVAHLLNEHPDLPEGLLGMQIALYDLHAVKQAIWVDPNAAIKPLGPRSPMAHLCFSKWHQARPDLRGAMMEIAQLLLENGAEVNDSIPVSDDNDHQLSVLYGALGHANNMTLARWLLENGAEPNDGESLYHATELGHHEGIDMLIAHGADPRGTNALLRAMDFDDHEAVRKLIAAGADVNEFVAEEVGGELPWVLPALHQAARRMCSQPMIEVLMEAGADPSIKYDGVTAYGYARVFGNQALAKTIEAAGVAPVLSEEEELLAMAADGVDPGGRFVDPDKLPQTYREMLGNILATSGKMPHVERLVAIGLEYDRPNREGLTPVQIAGWEGLPEVMDYFLRQKPDLSHVNSYGGNLFSTILHGSENCPHRADRNHVACLELALTEGVALPRRALDLAGEEEVRSFLAEWAETHPGQVIEGGLV